MRIKKNIESDPIFEQHLEAIRGIELKHTPDVVDAVMGCINDMPQPMGRSVARKHSVFYIASSAVAACFALAVVVTFVIGQFHENQAQAATTTHGDLSLQFFEVYEYCNDYADPEADETTSYNDNPVSDLL